MITVVLEDYEEKHAPPTENVLMVNVVADQVFLQICSSSEDYDTRHFDVVEQISVNVRQLLHAIMACTVDEKYPNELDKKSLTDEELQEIIRKALDDKCGTGMGHGDNAGVAKFIVERFKEVAQ